MDILYCEVLHTNIRISPVIRGQSASQTFNEEELESLAN